MAQASIPPVMETQALGSFGIKEITWPSEQPSTQDGEGKDRDMVLFPTSPDHQRPLLSVLSAYIREGQDFDHG